MYIQTYQTIKNPCLFDINKICSDYITNHIKKYGLIGIKYYFKVIFNHNQVTNTYFISTASFFSEITNNAIDHLSIHFLETEFYGNDLRINLEDSLQHYIGKILKNGHTFSHINKMNISTINDRPYMTYEYYIHQPMPYIQRRINIIVAKNHPFEVNSFK